MRKMFRVIVVALLLLVWNANAQECSKSKAEKLAKELGLTADQKQKVEALHQQCNANNQGVAFFQTEIKSILSAEQYAEYEKIYGKEVGKKSCCSKKAMQGEGAKSCDKDKKSCDKDKKSCDKDKKSCSSQKEGKSCDKDKKSCSSEAKDKSSCSKNKTSCSAKKA